MVRSRSTFAAGVAVVALTLSACGSGGVPAPTMADTPNYEAGTTMARIAGAGRMRVGIQYDQPGFGLKGLDGRLSGFDVELAKMIATATGLTADNIGWVESPSTVRELLLENDTVDLVAATRATGQPLMVRSDNATVRGLADLKANPGQRVCSVTGSTPMEKIKPYLADPTQLVSFDVDDKCADALRTNQVQVVAAERITLADLVAKSDKAFKLVGEARYGIGVKNGDVKFCEFINTTLKNNAAAYAKAWADTAAKIEGAPPPALPLATACA